MVNHSLSQRNIIVLAIVRVVSHLPDGLLHPVHLLLHLLPEHGVGIQPGSISNQLLSDGPIVVVRPIGILCQHLVEDFS